jgi:hypothetical protein
MNITKERLFSFLEDDLKKLKKAIEQNNKEEIETFFSYWEIHLKSLK